MQVIATYQMYFEAEHSHDTEDDVIITTHKTEMKKVCSFISQR